jgi:hypothetical protein
MDKECNDGNIDHKHKNSCRRWMSKYFVDLEREERASDDYAKPHGPTFHQPKPASLGQEERGINKAADCQILNPIRGEGGRFKHDVTNITAARIQAESCNPLFQESGYVAMNEPESADTNSDQKCSLEELEYGDQTEQLCVRGFHATASS